MVTVSSKHTLEKSSVLKYNDTATKPLCCIVGIFNIFMKQYYKKNSMKISLTQTSCLEYINIDRNSSESFVIHNNNNILQITCNNIDKYYTQTIIDVTNKKLLKNIIVIMKMMVNLILKN
jgi:hypothetical protein